MKDSDQCWLKTIQKSLVTALVLISVFSVFHTVSLAETGRSDSGDGWYLTEDMILFIEDNDGWQDFIWHGYAEEISKLILGKNLTEFDMFCELLPEDSRYVCPELKPTEIIVEEGNPVFYTENKCLYNRKTKELVLAEVDVTDVDVPEGITGIETYAFEDRIQLRSIHIPDSVTYIGDYTFAGCAALSDMQFPQKLETIGALAFAGCDGLKTIHLPDTITNIGRNCFIGCDGLENVDVSNIDLQEFPGGMFFDCSNLSTVILPENIRAIGSDAFNGCTKLASVDIPTSVTEIGAYAFLGCKSLSSIDLPDGIKEINAYTFWGCTGLTTFDIPDSVQRIGVNAFTSCTFPILQFPDGITLEGGETSKDYLSPNEQTELEKRIKCYCVYKVQFVVFEGDATITGDQLIREKAQVLFLKKPPKIETIVTYLFESATIYYLDEYAQYWAPNGETEWNGYSIHQITRRQVEVIIANAMSPTPSPSPTMAPTNTPVMQEENSVPIETEKETSSIDAMMIILGCSISVVLLIIVILVVKRSRNKK